MNQKGSVEWDYLFVLTICITFLIFTGIVSSCSQETTKVEALETIPGICEKQKELFYYLDRAKKDAHSGVGK